VPPEVYDAPHDAPKNPSDRILYASEWNCIVTFDNGKTMYLPSSLLEGMVGVGVLECGEYYVVILPGLKNDNHADREEDHVWMTTFSPNGPFSQGPPVGTEAADNLLKGIIAYLVVVPEAKEKAG
jgi:hypothetical protein